MSPLNELSVNIVSNDYTIQNKRRQNIKQEYESIKGRGERTQNKMVLR